MTRHRLILLVVVATLSINLCHGGNARADLFEDGETVVFLGDSITHGRRYHGMISAYYLTRFPNRTVRFVNAGVSGDSAAGALGRLQEDVLSKSPSTVVVMLGMNDVGRGNYVAKPTDKQRAAQQWSLASYRANMGTLLKRLSDDTSAKLVLLTPSPFDQTCVNQRNNNQLGCNDGLAECGTIVRQLATRHNAQVIDLHGPMTAFNLQHQKRDPAYTLIGPDRVHPGLPGNLMMAWLFLRAQGAPALVSRVEMDAEEGHILKVANATVGDVQRNADGWTFTVLEKALPFPVEAAIRAKLPTVPLAETLNQQILRIAGLKNGSHVLMIDGSVVATHSAAEWAVGVNLAWNRASPQVKQAQRVAAINEQRRQTEVRLRGYAAVRWFLRHRRVDPDDLDAVKSYAEKRMAKTGYYERQVPTYLKEWEQRAHVVARVAALEQEALRARAPVPHTYDIRPAPPAK